MLRRHWLSDGWEHTNTKHWHWLAFNNKIMFSSDPSLKEGIFWFMITPSNKAKWSESSSVLLRKSSWRFTSLVWKNGQFWSPHSILAILGNFELSFFICSFSSLGASILQHLKAVLYLLYTIKNAFTMMIWRFPHAYRFISLLLLTSWLVFSNHMYVFCFSSLLV